METRAQHYIFGLERVVTGAMRDMDTLQHSILAIGMACTILFVAHDWACDSEAGVGNTTYSHFVRLHVLFAMYEQFPLHSIL